MASAMFAAPTRDLRQALIRGSLGPLNPFPWAMMTGNCLGWVVYGYYTSDPFVVAANIPGLVLSLWLNMGAAKLQYLEISESKKKQTNSHASREHWDASPETEEHSEMPDMSYNEDMEDALVMVPQERVLLRVLVAWLAVIVWVGWFSSYDAANTVGLVVNVNLVFFYGAPLKTIRTVMADKDSSSIHLETMGMTFINTSFWIAYGLARHDFVIVLPNAAGLSLGLAQGLLSFIYPRRLQGDQHELLSQEEPSPEEDIPTIGSRHEVI